MNRPLLAVGIAAALALIVGLPLAAIALDLSDDTIVWSACALSAIAHLALILAGWRR